MMNPNDDFEKHLNEEPVGGTDRPDDAAEPAPAEAEPTEGPGPNAGPEQTPSAEPEIVYRWTYADQQAHDAAVPEKKKGRAGLVYALTVGGVFLVAFGLLLAVLILTGNATEWAEGIRRNFGVSEIDPQSREDVAGVEAAKNSVVVIEVTTQTPNGPGGGTGTGVVLTKEGYIATNHHVIKDAEKIVVSFYNGRYARATVVGFSEMDDLAVIKVEASDELVPATFADSSQCYVGQPVYAIGTPAGSDFSWTTTRGIISYVDRFVKEYSSDGTMSKKLRLLQTDANVNPGNSGGPLINTDGEVIGIVSMKLADGYEGIGFAIPSDGALDILEAIIAYGNADSVNSSLSFKRPVLGIVGAFLNANHSYVTDSETSGVLEVTDMTLQERLDYLREYMAFNPSADGSQNLDRFSEVISPVVSGVYVMSITPGTGAAECLQVGDSIIRIQGLDVESMNGMMNVINKYYPGDTVELVVVRAHREIKVEMKLSAQE